LVAGLLQALCPAAPTKAAWHQYCVLLVNPMVIAATLDSSFFKAVAFVFIPNSIKLIP